MQVLTDRTAKALIEKLMGSSDPADQARMTAQARLIEAYEPARWPRRAPSLPDLLANFFENCRRLSNVRCYQFELPTDKKPVRQRRRGADRPQGDPKGERAARIIRPGARFSENFPHGLTSSTRQQGIRIADGKQAEFDNPAPRRVGRCRAQRGGGPG
jgi:hypothetical protein